jgi:hypothetical protein
MGIGHIGPQELPQVQVECEGVRAPLVNTTQGKLSSPTQVQDALGDQVPIQEQNEVPHVPEQDQGQAQRSGDVTNIEAQGQAQVQVQDTPQRSQPSEE